MAVPHGLATFPGSGRIRTLISSPPVPRRGSSTAGRGAPGAKQFYTDYLKMFQHEQLDAVVIATPPNTHTEIAIAAAKRGIHVLLEKPMATGTRECDEIINAVNENHTLLTLSHEKRFNPGFEEIKKIIDDGVLGEPFYLVVHWTRPCGSIRISFARLITATVIIGVGLPAAGGGILFDHMPHYLDLWPGGPAPN